MSRRPRSRVPIDLLPAAVRGQQHARRAFRIAVAGAVGLAVVLSLVTVLGRMQINGAQERLNGVREEAASLQQEVNGLKQYETLQISLDQTRQTLATALVTDLSWSRFLDNLDTVMPADAWLTGLIMSADPGVTPLGEPSLGTVSYQGYVRTFPGLSGWLDTMAKQKGLRFVYLTNGQKQELGGQKIVAFSASTHLSDAMLSGRCQKDGALCP